MENKPLYPNDLNFNSNNSHSNSSQDNSNFQNNSGLFSNPAILQLLKAFSSKGTNPQNELLSSVLGRQNEGFAQIASLLSGMTKKSQTSDESQSIEHKKVESSVTSFE